MPDHVRSNRRSHPSQEEQRVNTPDHVTAVLTRAEPAASTPLSWLPCAGACGSWVKPGRAAVGGGTGAACGPAAPGRVARAVARPGPCRSRSGGGRQAQRRAGDGHGPVRGRSRCSRSGQAQLPRCHRHAGAGTAGAVRRSAAAGADEFRGHPRPLAEALRRYDSLRVPGVLPDFLQGREPKIRADDLRPVQWLADPGLEWCPPGHGDIYTALAASGTLDALLGAGLRYAFVSNSDNLGAVADVRIAAWLAAQQVPFALEAVRGTRPTARAATWPVTRAGWYCGRRRRCPTATPGSPTWSAGAGSRPTTSGSTCARSGTAGRRPGRTSSAVDRQPRDRRSARPG